MSTDQFSKFLRLYEAKGGVVDAGLFIAYAKGLSIAISFLRHPEEVDILRRGETSHRVILIRMRMTMHALERDILPRYPTVLPGSIAVALLKFYLHLPHVRVDIWRAWDALKSSPLHFRTKAVNTLQRYPLDAVSELWEDYLTADIVPSPEDWDAFMEALRKGGAYAGQVRALVDRIPDYPEVRAAMASVAPSADHLECASEALLEHTSLPAPRVARILHYVHRAQRRVGFLIPQSEDLPEA
ncbi:hypothetical protein AURDEDRAFT_113466 [Auricularia subglabra TFB-10046 SS5]|nr:hypothetical protein AURDEDRAFT_113466 [Auricularia subglabra TFB-10046 SS5]